jgi:hypothetical protein
VIKVRFRPTPNLEFELEGATHKDIFALLAEATELAEPNCGACESDDIYYRVRNVTTKSGPRKGKSYTYYEMVCRACGCVLKYGVHNNDRGTLFPDRKVDGEYDRENHGWRKPVKWADDPEADEEK